MKLSTPGAILIGLGLIATALFIRPDVSDGLISDAHAELDSYDYQMFSNGFKGIERAINNLNITCN